MKKDDENLSRIKLKGLLYQKVGFYGRMISAHQKNKMPFKVLLRPAEVGGIKVEHIWLNTPHLMMRLRRNHVLWQTRLNIDGRPTIEFSDFYVLRGQARVNHYVKVFISKGQKYYQEDYGITKPDSLLIYKRNEYVKAVKKKVAVKIARKDHLLLQKASQKFMSSNAYGILLGLYNSTVGVGPETFFKLYQKEIKDKKS